MIFVQTKHYATLLKFSIDVLSKLYNLVNSVGNKFLSFFFNNKIYFIQQCLLQSIFKVQDPLKLFVGN